MLDAVRDLLRFLVGAAGCWLLFWLGSRLRGAPRQARNVAAILGMVLVLFVSGLLNPVYEHIGGLLLVLGGPMNVTLLLAFALLGVLFGTTSGKVVRQGAVAIGLMLYLLVLINASSPLVWRCGLAERLNARPNADGILRQATPFTCAAASAAMVLNRRGVPVTEGQTAQATHCTLLFGTEDFGLADGMTKLAADHGLDVELRRATAEESLHLPMPYVAGISHPELGSHSVVVEAADGGVVTIVDPFRGRREQFGPAQWEQAWGGRAITVTAPGGADAEQPSDH